MRLSGCRKWTVFSQEMKRPPDKQTGACVGRGRWGGVERGGDGVGQGAGERNNAFDTTKKKRSHKSKCLSLQGVQEFTDSPQTSFCPESVRGLDRGTGWTPRLLLIRWLLLLLQLLQLPKCFLFYYFFFLRHPDQQDNEKRFDEGSVLSTKRTPAEPRCDGGASITAD